MKETKTQVDGIEINIQDSVQPQLTKVQSQVDGMHQSITDKMEEEAKRLTGHFYKSEKRLEKRFEDLTVQMKTTLDEHADNLRQQYNQELKN